MLKTDATPQAARRDDRLYLGAPPIPDDHGAAMLLLPMVIGFILGIVRGVAPSAGALEVAMACVLFAVALVALFFASEPLSVAFKPKASTGARRRAVRWLAIYLAVAACAGVPLLFVWGLWGLGWFLLIAGALMLAFLVAVKMRKQRSMALRLPGILCLTLSGPAASTSRRAGSTPRHGGWEWRARCTLWARSSMCAPGLRSTARRKAVYHPHVYLAGSSLRSGCTSWAERLASTNRIGGRAPMGGLYRTGALAAPRHLDSMEHPRPHSHQADRPDRVRPELRLRHPVGGCVGLGILNLRS